VEPIFVTLNVVLGVDVGGVVVGVDVGGVVVGVVADGLGVTTTGLLV